MSQDNKNDFYIGWQEKAPDGYANKSKKFIWILFLIIPVIAISLVLSQQGFESSNFEYGKLTDIEGVLFLEPVPMIKIKEKETGKIKSILLVGFGKMGAGKTFQEYQDQSDVHDFNLNNVLIKLRGTLIYHDGKTLLELTEGVSSIIDWPSNSVTLPPTQKSVIGNTTLRGEIYDPKCAFGVMKPGYGKPHRSCAVRCISGGIPPVLKIENKAGEKNYCLLLSPDGKPINESVLEYVADQVQVCGRLEQQDDWLVFYTDPKQDILRLQPYWLEGDLVMCAD